MATYATLCTIISILPSLSINSSEIIIIHLHSTDYCAESGMVGGYNCLPERKCLPQSYVCDSIPDCVNVRSFEAVDELGECAGKNC